MLSIYYILIETKSNEWAFASTGLNWKQALAECDRLESLGFTTKLEVL